jgi:hypothetical protein
MKHAATTLLFLLVSSISAYTQKSEVKAVTASFDNYKQAILNDKGEEAVQYVDSRTINYYGDVLEKVRSADSATVNRLDLLDKVMVFSVRHRATKEDILSFDGKGLLVYAIKSGMVGKNSVVNSSIGDVTVEGTFAKGQYVSNGQKAPFNFDFYKEDNAWKVDLTSIFSTTNIAFRKLVEESGQTENEFLFSILERLTGRRPGDEIWIPTQKL